MCAVGRHGARLVERLPDETPWSKNSSGFQRRQPLRRGFPAQPFLPPLEQSKAFLFCNILAEWSNSPLPWSSRGRPSDSLAG